MTREEAIRTVYNKMSLAAPPGFAADMVDSLIALGVLKIETEYTTTDLAREALRVRSFNIVGGGHGMLSAIGIDQVLEALRHMGLEIVKK